MTNLDIYFSDACNANCSYCIIRDQEHNTNAAIRQALEDNTFVTNVRHVLTPETKSIGFWGREPSINGQYFATFISNLLDYSPYIRYIIIPTNGQSLSFYRDFVASLYAYCNTHSRKIKCIIQFSLDGPPDLHNYQRGEGSFQRCINNINYIFNNFDFQNKYLRLLLTTKSTLTGYEIENYSPDKWRDYMHKLCHAYAEKNKGYNNNYIGQEIATLEVPGNYTVAQGQALKNWKGLVRIDSNHFHNCLAGISSKTIDYLGNLYDCHLLANKDITQEEFRAQFKSTMDTLVDRGEAIEQDRDKLFNAISNIYCWGAQDKNLGSYIRLLGNGFLL